MKSLLLHAHDEPAFDARLQVALDLARAFNGHLTLYHAISFTMIMPGDPYGFTAADLGPAAKAQAEQFRKKTEARLAGEDVPWDWIEELGVAASGLIDHAALADLAIVGAGNPGGGKGASRLAGVLAIQCRVPIMIVPDDARGIAANGAAVVAWNGSLEASRALRAALPMLAAASAVTLVSVREPGEEKTKMLPALDGARYLDRHEIACEVVEIERGEHSVSHVLREAARARDASFMVMGAYGLPRVIETIFGGVTKDMLTEPDIPVLLSH